MKKFLLTALVCFLSIMSANATQWVNIPTDNNSSLIYVDKDAVQYTRKDSCYYPVLVKPLNGTPRVIFIASNFANKTAGIFTEQDYNPQKYNPGFIFSVYQAFMKPVVKNTIIDYAHSYMNKLYETTELAKESNYNKTSVAQGQIILNSNTTIAISQMKKSIISNWILSNEGRNKNAIVLISIGDKGSLNSYNIIKSTGSDTADRAILSAIELAAPFYNVENITMRLNFHAKVISKLVY